MDAGRVFVIASTVSALVVTPSLAWAHAAEQGGDPPLPTEYLLVGLGSVLLLTVGLLWRSTSDASLRSTPRERILDWPWLRGAGFVAGLVAVVLFLVGAVAGLVGSDDPTRNPLPLLVWPIFWPAVALLAVLVGNVYPALSPWRRIAQVFGLGERERVLHEERVGYWPGAVVFVLFAWMVFVSPFGANPRQLAVAVLVYTAYVLVYIDMFGRDTALETGDGFGVYAMLVAGVAPLERTGGGDVVWRGWFRGLAQLPERPGFVAMVAVMVGAAAFDAIASTIWWMEGPSAVIEAAVGIAGADSWRTLVPGTVGLVASIVLVWLAYLGAVWFTARTLETSAAEAASRFVHTLIPTAIGFVLAHTVTAIVDEGRRLVAVLSDPFDRGWDLFGTVDLSVGSAATATPIWLWLLQVTVLLGALVVGILLARDRAAVDLSEGSSISKAMIPVSAFLALLVGLGLVIFWLR